MIGYDVINGIVVCRKVFGIVMHDGDATVLGIVIHAGDARLLGIVTHAGDAGDGGMVTETPRLDG